MVTLDTVILFAIIFIWTPPHFWALALVKSGDYARAGVPMLPNVRGPDETRRQILLYTLLLVPVGVLPALTGFGGLLYLGVSVVTGAWMLLLALRVYRRREGPEAGKACLVAVRFFDHLSLRPFRGSHRRAWLWPDVAGDGRLSMVKPHKKAARELNDDRNEEQEMEHAHSPENVRDAQGPQRGRSAAPAFALHRARSDPGASGRLVLCRHHCQTRARCARSTDVEDRADGFGHCSHRDVMTQHNQSSTQKQAMRKTVITCLGVVFGMVGLAYASVPLYDLFLSGDGFRGHADGRDCRCRHGS